MDLWVVAAAAGASYVAKANYLNKFSAKLTDSSLESHALDCGHGQQNSWNLLYKFRHKYCPMCRLEGLEESYGKSEHLYKFSESLAETKQKAISSGRLITGRQLKTSSNDYIQNSLYPYESPVTAEMQRFEESENEFLPFPGTAAELPLTANFPQQVEIEAQQTLHTKPQKKSTLFSASSHTQGSFNGLLLFLLGATVGVMYSAAANKSEVDDLNDTLKRNMKLVEDLHDELKMEDLLTVTEIGNEDVKVQEGNKLPSGRGTPPTFQNKQEQWESTTAEKAANSEAMREIEAELEAELVRLELTLKSSFLEEHDREEMAEEKPATASDSDYDIDEAYFGVSPKKLSLRLHEVVQSRLEARIIELEAALENSQRRLLALESASSAPGHDFSDEAEATSDQEKSFNNGFKLLP